MERKEKGDKNRKISERESRKDEPVKEGREFVGRKERGKDDEDEASNAKDIIQEIVSRIVLFSYFLHSDLSFSTW